jgi:hypothetical protein
LVSPSNSSSATMGASLTTAALASSSSPMSLTSRCHVLIPPLKMGRLSELSTLSIMLLGPSSSRPVFHLTIGSRLWTPPPFYSTSYQARCYAPIRLMKPSLAHHWCMIICASSVVDVTPTCPPPLSTNSLHAPLCVFYRLFYSS